MEAISHRLFVTIFAEANASLCFTLSKPFSAFGSEVTGSKGIGNILKECSYESSKTLVSCIMRADRDIVH